MFSEPYRPVTRDLADLRKVRENQTHLHNKATKPIQILLKDLRVHTHHTGDALVLRVIASAVQHNGIFCAVEDKTGDVEWLGIYHWKETSSLKSSLPIGTIIAVKEPFLKMTPGKLCSLRVDHAGDVDFLQHDHSDVPRKWRRKDQKPPSTAIAWKERGNNEFREKKLEMACRR